MTIHRSHVVSWNLTQRCNLQCEHCYISGGKITKEEAEGELSTEECFRVIDDLAEVNPEALLILTGGEPLLRKDVFEIASYAHEKGFWVVVGTNGVFLTDDLCARMIEAGIRGVSLSLDALDAETHDRFRNVRGAWQNTVNGSQTLKRADLPFIVQTTVGRHNHNDVEKIAALAFDLGAKVFNLYFLVSTGRGVHVTDVTPDEYETLMHDKVILQRCFSGRMLVNAKCAPHYQRILFEEDAQSPFMKTFSEGAGGCPAGTHYVGIRPNGDVTPCPYLPVYGGNLRNEAFSAIWNDSDVFQTIRKRNTLGGNCGTCEFNATCGGCRARAYGETGDFMADDPWCVYEPGKYGFEPVNFAGKTVYGIPAEQELVWTDAAKERLQLIPGFVRGTVRTRVEEYAKTHGHQEISAELMHKVREETVGGRIGNMPSFVRKMLERKSPES